MVSIRAFYFDDRELAAVLAGLRLLQRSILEDAFIAPDIRDLLTNGDLSYALGVAEIDDLCTELSGLIV